MMTSIDNDNDGFAPQKTDIESPSKKFVQRECLQEELKRIKKTNFRLLSLRKSLRQTGKSIFQNTLLNIRQMSIHQKEKFEITTDSLTQVDRIKNQSKIFVYPPYIVPAQGLFKNFWDVIIGILVIYTSLLSPLDIAFNIQSSTIYEAYVIVDYCIIIAFVLDILINFRTTYFDFNLAEIVNSKMIASNYVKNYNFYVDIVSTIPISEISQIIIGTSIKNNYTRIFKQFKLFRVLRLAKLTKYLKSENLKSLINLVKIFVVFLVSVCFNIIIILKIHWLTCIWFYISRLDYQVAHIVWIPPNIRNVNADLASSIEEYYERFGMFDQYSYALYSLSTLILGNDIGPVNSLQVSVAILISIAGQFFLSVLFGYLHYLSTLLGEVSILIIKWNSDKSQYLKQVDSMEKKFITNQFPESIKVRMVEYFDYVWQKQQMKCNTIVDFKEFSRPLVNQIHFFLKKDLIKEVPFFYELDSAEILYIINSLKFFFFFLNLIKRVEVFLPDDYIIRQGEMGDSMYFMISGKAKIIVKQNDETVIQVFHIGKGSFFGEVGLIMRQKRTADVKALDFCICESFNRESFMKLKVLFPRVEKRLRGGFSHYKVKNIESIMEMLTQTYYFSRFSKSELSQIVKDYLDLRLIDANELILYPKPISSALYFIFSGNVLVLKDNEEAQLLLQRILIKKKGLNVNKQRKIPEQQYFDYEVNNETNQFHREQLILEKGDFFGVLPDTEFKTNVSNYYISYGAVTLLMLRKDKYQQMKIDNLDFYNRIQNNNILEDGNKHQIEEMRIIHYNDINQIQAKMKSK